jgi:hypothetical protein
MDAGWARRDPIRTGLAARLIVLVDTLPHLVLSEGELAGRYFAEIARVLHASADVVILNFSYRDAVAADRRDLERLILPLGLTLVRGRASPRFLGRTRISSCQERVFIRPTTMRRKSQCCQPPGGLAIV